MNGSDLVATTRALVRLGVPKRDIRAALHALMDEGPAERLAAIAALLELRRRPKRRSPAA